MKLNFDRVMIDTALNKTAIDRNHPLAKAAVDILETTMETTDWIQSEEGIMAFMVGFMKGGEYGTTMIQNLIKEKLK